MGLVQRVFALSYFLARVCGDGLVITDGVIPEGMIAPPRVQMSQSVSWVRSRRVRTPRATPGGLPLGWSRPYAADSRGKRYCRTAATVSGGSRPYAMISMTL